MEFIVSDDKHPINHAGIKLGIKALLDLEAIVAGKARCAKWYFFLGPPGTECFGTQKLVIKKNTVKRIDPILENVKQYHGIVSWSSLEATGAYDRDKETECGCSELVHELGDDDDEVPATSEELEVVYKCEQELAGLKRRRLFGRSEVV